MQPIETDRLIVRETIPDDWKAYQEIIVHKQSDPDLWYTDHQWDTEDASIRDAVTYLAGTGEWYSVCLKSSGDVTGYVCMGVHDGSASIGYAFHPLHRGQGYATEGCAALVARAFSELGATAINAGTASHNLASLRLLERLGMKKIRSLTASFANRPDGSPIEFEGSEYVMTLDEWRGRENA